MERLNISIKSKEHIEKVGIYYIELLFNDNYLNNCLVYCNCYEKSFWSKRIPTMR